MKKTVFTVLLFCLYALPALAAPTNTSGPWGIDSGGFQNLSSAVSSPSTANKTIVITKPMTVNTLTIPANRTLDIKKGGKITVNSGKILTLQNPLSAGLYQIFDGAGTVAFNNAPIDAAYPEWWGADPVGSTESATPLQSAITAVQGTPIKLKLNGNYKVSTALNIARKIFIEGNGHTTGIINRTPTGSAAFIIDGSGQPWPYANLSTFQNFAIIGDGSTSGSAIKYLDRCAYLQFQNLLLEGNNHGIWHHRPTRVAQPTNWGTAYAPQFRTVFARANYGIGFYDDSTDNPDPGAQFLSCIADLNTISNVNWGSGEISLYGGTYQNGYLQFNRRAVINGAYFELSTADYGGLAIVRLGSGAYGSVIENNNFGIGETANIAGISYSSVLNTISNNKFYSSGSAAGRIGIKNLTGASTSSKLYNNYNTGGFASTLDTSVTNFEAYYMDTAGTYHYPSLATAGFITAGDKLTVGASGTSTKNQVILVDYCAAGTASNGSIFVDSGTGKLSFKNYAGTTAALY